MDDRPGHPDDESDSETSNDDFDAADDSAEAPSEEPVSEAVAGEPRAGEAPTLPHWTDPPTGEVPKIFETSGQEDDDLAAWSTVASAQPRWRDQARDWDDSDLRVLGEDLPPVGVREEDTAGERFTFDDTGASPETYSVPRDPTEPHGGRGADPYADTRTVPAGSGRNMGQAVGVGVALAVVAGFLLRSGAKYTMALVVVVLVLAAAEFFSTLRRTGYSPPTLVGLAATAVLPLAAYWHGESGLVLGVVLTLATALLWYLLDIGGDHAVPNVGVTMLGVVYIGVFGSFAALLLRNPNGTGLLLAAIIGTVAYDVAGLFVGRSMGRSPLSVSSPNKTVEGTVGGMVAAVVATVLITGQIHPFDSFSDAFILGLVIAVVAPIGDLCESRLKRDLGVKDMGNLLPGHGGLLDRFDALLFVLPATYYMARVLL